MICGMTLYQVLWYFMIYAIVGWVIEVSYHAITLGKVVNRGFLNGPLCPVYGAGVIMVLSVLYGVGVLFDVNTDVTEASPLMMFVIGIIFATLIELIAGFLLDKLFHARWWDYSDRKFNLNGYICLEFSIIWGLAIAFVLREVQPAFAKIVSLIPKGLGVILLVVMYVIFVADIVVTVLTVLKLNKELEKMEEIQKSILRISDEMSEVIGNGTIKVMNTVEEKREESEKKREEIKDNRAARKAEYEAKKAELEERLENMKKQIVSRKVIGTGRLVNAFPHVKHNRFQKQIEALQAKRK